MWGPFKRDPQEPRRPGLGPARGCKEHRPRRLGSADCWAAAPQLGARLGLVFLHAAASELCVGVFIPKLDWNLATPVSFPFEFYALKKNFFHYWPVFFLSLFCRRVTCRLTYVDIPGKSHTSARSAGRGQFSPYGRSSLSTFENPCSLSHVGAHCCAPYTVQSSPLAFHVTHRITKRNGSC